LHARVDANKIKQVFWNLCDNALRAMPEGGTLTVKLNTPVLAAHRLFKTRYRPSTQSKGPRIFEPLQSGFRGGTGLGAGSIVYQIVQAHSG